MFFAAAAEAASIKDTLSDEGGVLSCLSSSVAGAGPEQTDTQQTHSGYTYLPGACTPETAANYPYHATQTEEGGLKHVFLVCDTG